MNEQEKKQGEKELFNEVERYSDSGRHNEAIERLTKAIELNPKNAKMYNYRGISYKAKKDYDQAIIDFNKAIEFDSENAAGSNRTKSQNYSSTLQLRTCEQ